MGACQDPYHGGHWVTTVGEPPDTMPVRPPWFYSQSAAIPLRFRDGAGHVLLVTSRSGKRWVIHKGIVEADLSPAAKEAWEESGVRGGVRPGSVGTCRYQEWGGTCMVDVFVLDVERLEDAWPEQALRRRRWFGIDGAAGLVREEDLAKMIRALIPGISKGRPAVHVALPVGFLTCASRLRSWPA